MIQSVNYIHPMTNLPIPHNSKMIHFGKPEVNFGSFKAVCGARSWKGMKYSDVEAEVDCTVCKREIEKRGK